METLNIVIAYINDELDHKSNLDRREFGDVQQKFANAQQTKYMKAHVKPGRMYTPPMPPPLLLARMVMRKMQ